MGGEPRHDAARFVEATGSTGCPMQKPALSGALWHSTIDTSMGFLCAGC